jgi:hypothetical protein
VGFGISIVELCVNSGEPVKVTGDFVYRILNPANEVKNYCKFDSPAGFDIHLTVQSLHSELYNGLINEVKEAVINFGYGQIQKVSANTNLNP